MKHHILTLAGLTVILVVAAVFDYLNAATLIGPFKVAMAIVAISFIIALWRTTGKKSQLIYLAVFFVCFVSLRLFEISPVKPFRKFYLDLHPGLTQPDITSKLEHYFPNGGRYKQPSATLVDDDSMVVVLDENDGRYNAEVVHIVFQNGHLKSAAYYPD